MSIDSPPSPVVDAPVKASPQKQTRRQTSSSLFRVIWRWHFYAGLIVSPILVVVAVTGGIYLFGAEIGDLVNRELLYVDSTSGGIASYPAMMAAAEQSISDGKATRIQTFADPGRTAAVSIEQREKEGENKQGRKRGEETTVYVNPYTAEVQAQSSGPRKLEGFFRLILKIHRQLFIGTTGRIIVELSTTWACILFLSGVYLWWPRRREKKKGVWVPRWTAKPYVLLRDLHALAGVYLLPICLTIIISGLFYTLVWGESFHYVSSRAFAMAADEDETKAEEPQEEGEGDDNGKQEEEEPYVAPTFELQEAVTKARSLHPHRDVTVKLPTGSSDHYDVSAINDYARGTYGAMNSTGFKLHRETGDVLEVGHLSENERYWWHTWAYPLHVGSVLGLTSKIFWLLACVVLTALPVTGLWMWWKRRPQGRSGFPRKPSYDVVPVWVWGGIVLLSFLLPVFGLSVILILVLDGLVRVGRLVFRRRAIG